MNKRALMLTAAAAALLSGRAYAATSPCNSSSSTPSKCDITTDITVPVYTGAVPASVSNGETANTNITIESNGSITINTNPPTAPALTINSNATVSNLGTISYQGVNSAVGVLLEEASVPASAGPGVNGTAENFTGEYYSTGTLNLLGTGTGKTGILIAGGAFPTVGGPTDAGVGNYANTGLGVFTGVTGFQPSGGSTPVVIDLAQGSTLEVQGTGSYGIKLIGPSVPTTGQNPVGGATIIGDIDIGGTVTLTPATAGSTSPTGNIAIDIVGWQQPATATNTNNPALAAINFAACSTTKCPFAMVGNINISSTGHVTSEGAGAEGLVVQGAIDGNIVNSGNLATFGTANPSTALNANDPEAGSALVIANNITGGIFNAGPAASNNIPRATIAMTGASETIDISPGANSIEPLPITIGGYTDTAGVTFSLLNRGNITANSEDANIPNTAISISGTSATADVTLTNGIFNSGSITSSVVTNSAGPTNPATVTATAISIGNFVNFGNGTGFTDPNFGGPYSFVNSNESNGGNITARIAGDQTGTATAILILGPASGGSTPANLPAIFNSGTIAAAAQTTNLTLTLSGGAPAIIAYGIRDESGSLATIYNTGTISAFATELNNDSQLAVAIDVSSNTTSPVTISDISTPSNSAEIKGDIRFGTKNGTLIITGESNTFPALVSGNLTFSNATSTNDSIQINNFGSFSGEISEANGSAVDISIAQSGSLDLLTTRPTNINSTVSAAVTPNAPLSVGTLDISTGGNLDFSLSQGSNVDAFNNNVTIINANKATIGGDGIKPTLTLTFGSFIGTPSANGSNSEFVLISVPSTGTFTITPEELTLLTNTYDSTLNTNTSAAKNGIPFLFNSTICTFNVNVAGAPAISQCSNAQAAPSVSEPYNTANQELVLVLTPKTPQELGLTGYALRLFPHVNQALVNDNTLGAAVVTDVINAQQAQAAYASFAPDVTGATRATEISLTDSATDIVAARQRELRMYANQEGDMTLWGQQFAQRLSVSNTDALTGYNDSGFGFVLGADEGDPVDGRYGGAFTFFTGGESAKEPTVAKTRSQFYLLTGYTDWRGRGLFIDTQLTAGYGDLKGKRYLTLTDPNTNVTTTRVAEGNRPAELLAGSVTVGSVFTAGGTVFMPQFDLDGLTSREEAYTESGGGNGFDLRVQPYYSTSLRAFLGADVREDVNFGDFYLQPELRAGYRYDFLRGAEKLKTNFASVGAVNEQPLDAFSIEGPDPGHGNLVLGGGIATTTGAWSIGLNYDYVRSGAGPTQQSGILTLVGRI